MQPNESPSSPPESWPVLRAAQYVRMSTEHQQYSTENQGDKILEYAARRNIEIVRTYADEGKSGLRIDGRRALQQLIKDVEAGIADFQIILVYDVSRWGRFQDADESAYYEYICRRAGIQVAYCAEQFENDGSPVSTIVKGVKRAMAGEYSRELSAKVFAGQCRLIELGFRQGGPAGYGLRRVLVDQSGTLKGELARGEHKSLQTDRVILQPGPDDEVAVVNQIYRWFVTDNLTELDIAERLNAQGTRTDLGRDWTRATIHEVLSNEKYIGNNIYNRRSFKLKKHRVVNSPEMWIKKEGAFEGIVSPELFYTAQGILRARSHRYSDEELIEKLRNLYQRHGYLSGLIIDEAEGMGYDVENRLLVINETEAAVVRRIFEEMLTIGSPTQIAARLTAEGITTKAWKTQDGQMRQGAQIDKKYLHKILRNRIFLGEISHKGKWFPGVHAAIIDPGLWSRVHEVLAKDSHGRAVETKIRSRTDALLRGLLYAPSGERMYPTYSRKNGRKYHYYVSKSENRFGAPGKNYERLPALEIESAVIAQIRGVLTSPESIASVVRCIQRNGSQIDEATTVLAMARLNNVWEQLFPTERHRIANLMIERIDLVHAGEMQGIKVKWREIGWNALIEEFAPNSIGAELLEVEV